MENTKKRVLCISEFTGLSTGYARYGFELLSRLHASGKYEVFELAKYGVQPADRDKLQNIPWKVCPVLPQNPEEEKVYNSSPTNQFGEWKFESTCLDFLPDYVLEFSDPWMYNYQKESPFRNFFSWVLMPTLDACPQTSEWLETYQSADALLTYNDWAYDVLRFSSNNFPQLLGSAPPACPKEFVPLPDKQKRKQAILGKDCIVIGTVMRNQPRKDFPGLFDAFAKLLADTKRTDIYLYCHTNYPDMGWNIPDLLKRTGIANRVLFTYQCKNCKFVFPSVYQDIAMACPKCHGVAGTSSTRMPVSNSQLNELYNLFDLYVQASFLEGFGIGQCEAAASGVPVISTDYSAMSDVIRKLGGYPLPVSRYTKENTSGRLFAGTDQDSLVEYLKMFINLSSEQREQLGEVARYNYNKHYNYDTTAKMWMRAIDSTAPKLDWKSPPRLFQPNTNVPQGLNNKDYVRWLILNVLGLPNRAYSLFEAKMVRDCAFNCTLGHGGAPQPFDRNMALQSCLGIRNKWNYWENQRKLKFNL